MLRKRNVQSFVSIQFYCKNVTLPNTLRYVIHQPICHQSLVVSIQHCGRWGGGRAIWRCIPTADHSKTLASAWTHALRDGTLAINGHQVALANKEMCDREATPSIRLKITFRPPWPVWRMLIKSLRWHTVGKRPQCQHQTHTLSLSPLANMIN